MKYIIFVVVLLSIFVGVVYGRMDREETRDSAGITEEFILRWLQNDNGTIATYILTNAEADEDLVQGREALAETIGLLMYYALEKDDATLFNQVYNQLTAYFLEADGFINWKLNEDGTSDVSSNALIDDIRILYALVEAQEKWNKDQYMNTAVSISDYLTEHNVKNSIYTDFYETVDHYASSDIKLSYIDIQGMDLLVDHGFLEAETVANTAQVLIEAPIEKGFYPLSYNVANQQYTFSDPVNLIDQAILAYHFAQVGNPSEELLTFIKKEMTDRGLIHGMYDRDTKEPTVDYESPAIYGFLILYALEIGEEELAHALYNRMKEFQVTDKKSDYYGGYSITDGNTHIFDNLVPLLAEQEIKNH